MSNTINTRLIKGCALFLIFGSFEVAHSATELARVNKTIITLEEFNKRYDENLKFFPLKPPSKKMVLTDLIKREVGIQEAKRQELDKSPEVADRINSVLFNALLEKNLTKEIESIRVSDGEAKEFYKKNPFLRTSHILVSLSPAAKPNDQKLAYEKIKKIQKELDGEKSFAEVAQSSSEGPAAAMGGDIDFQSRDRLDPIYYEAALNLKSPGKVSDIVRSNFGYHIIKLTGIKAWEEIDKTQVKRALFEDQKQKLFEKYMNKLKAQSKITTHDELLKD